MEYKKFSNNIELPSNFSFGLFFSLIFLCFCIFFFYSKSNFLFYSFGLLSIILFIITIINAKLLMPLNRLWMNLGLFLGRIISPIVLGLIFFTLFTPLGLITRIFGRDELRLKLVQKRSHWSECNENKNKRESFKNQF